MTNDIPDRPLENAQAAIDKIPMTRKQAEMFFVTEWKNYYNRFVDANGDFIPEFVTADQNIMLLPLIYDRQGHAQTLNWDRFLSVSRGLSTARHEDFIAAMKAREKRWISECKKHSHGDLIMSLCRDICTGAKTPRQARDERAIHHNRVINLLLVGLNKWCIANGLGDFLKNI